jgi:hypothetical protein
MQINFILTRILNQRITINKYKRIIIHILFILFPLFSEPLLGQVRYDWKMNAMITGTYDWGNPPNGSSSNSDFWCRYSTDKDIVKKNILRSKKLGFNMVRISLIYKDKESSLNQYDHCWPIVPGSGLVSNNIDYLTNINDLLDFCSINNVKVDLLLFNFGGYNDIMWGNRNSNHSKYATQNGDTLLSDSEISNWYSDAIAWLDYIMGHIHKKNVEVFELYNEQSPLDEFQNPNLNFYPISANDIFLIEMSNYFHIKYKLNKLMISISGSQDQGQLFGNLKYALNRSYTRPSYLSRISQVINDPKNYKGLYFDYFSIHDYRTYSSKVEFNKILNLGEMQVMPYQWFIGECGFGIGDPERYEVDQAKYFVYLFQVVHEFSTDLRLSTHPNKGIGIWAMQDYKNSDGHNGIISSELTSPRKRMAAYVIENYFEGYIRNPDFEIGPGSGKGAHDDYSKYYDPNFGDAPFCNGWTPWWEGIESGNGADFNRFFNYRSDDTGQGHHVTISGNPGQKLGWSILPVKKIRVLPGTKMHLSVDISIKGDCGNSNVFPQMIWYDIDENVLGASPVKNTLIGKNIAVTDIVPDGAYFMSPFLMAWHVPSKSVISFDNVKLDFEAKPIITLKFINDNSFFNNYLGNTVTKSKTGWLGWNLAKGGNAPIHNSSNSINNYISITGNSKLYLSHSVGQDFTSIRIGNNKYYAVTILFKNSNHGYITIMGMKGDKNDYPISIADSIKDQLFNNNPQIWKSHTTKIFIPSQGTKWIDLLLENQMDVKEVTIFQDEKSY